METNRDVAMLREDLRRYASEYGPDLLVAAEVWRDLGAPAGDEPIVRCYYDPEAGYVVAETLRRFRRGGRPAPLGMGRPVEGNRDGLASDVAAPEGTMTVSGMLAALAGCGADEAVAIRLFEGSGTDVTDVGVASVMEFPLQEDGIWEDEGGSLVDSYGNPVPEGEDRVTYVVLCTTEEFLAG